MSCIYTYMCISSQSRSRHPSSCSLSATVMTVPKVGNLCLRILGYLMCMNFMIFLFILSTTVVSPKSSPREVFPAVTIWSAQLLMRTKKQSKEMPQWTPCRCSHSWKISKDSATRIFFDEATAGVCVCVLLCFISHCRSGARCHRQRLQNCSSSCAMMTTRLSLVHLIPPPPTHTHTGPACSPATFPPRIVRHSSDPWEKNAFWRGKS